jgi:formylglycine-generating enzyme required for sulfatase activity
VNDSLQKPYEPFINVLYDEKMSLATRQNALRVLSSMGGDRAIAILKKALELKDLVLANAAYNALESLGATAGIERPKQEKTPAIIKIDKDDSQMVLIPEGNFIYGSREDDKDARSNEKPQQTIYLPSFYMDVYPVTNRQYCLFLNDVKPDKKALKEWIDLSGKYAQEKCRIVKKGSDYIVNSGYDAHPVIYVTWYGAAAYAKWSGKRLPYEVEWEKAARGTDGRKYPWGQKFDSKFCNSSKSGIGHTTPVTSYPAGKSPYGCFDMAGNVLEWCADWFSDNNDKSGPERGLKGPLDGSVRVFRGGSWYDDAAYVRCAFRYGYAPADRSYDLGLRLCQDI